MGEKLYSYVFQWISYKVTRKPAADSPIAVRFTAWIYKMQLDNKLGLFPFKLNMSEWTTGALCAFQSMNQ